ncbi:MAG TPA: hypothetical protein VKA70_20235 [Blastocatellia bacterium]|nr:hypothetical protein [Blastocatellia bacterium]
MRQKTIIAPAVAAAVATLFLIAGVSAQDKSRRLRVDGSEVTILVTAHPHSDRTRQAAGALQPGDFSVREEKRPQQILSAKRASEAPLVLAVLIQDDLVTRVNNEIKQIKEFIRGLPEGSRVMTGYLTAGSINVTQDFTTDRQRAADSLRIIKSSASSAPFNPYVEVREALKRFDAEPEGRRMILLVSDGLDISRGFSSASPTLSIDLDRAIADAQRRGVAVFTFYAPSVGVTGSSRIASNFGQGSLNRLADETGGEAFFSGTDFVSFEPYLKDLKELMGLQWVITYRSSNTRSGFRRIEVTAESDVHLHHPKGYRPAK